MQQRKLALFTIGEIQRRLNENKFELWYLSVLTKNDVTKWEQLRLSNYVDVTNQLIIILDNL